MISSRVLKIKSEELEIPFANILSGCVIEEVLKTISAGEYGQELWLCNEKDLGLDNYKKKPVLELFYCYGKDKELQQVAYALEKELEEQLGKAGWGVESDHKACGRDKQEIELNVSLEEMYIPVKVQIEKRDKIYGYPKQEGFRLFMENNKTVSLWIYPMEQSVAYHITEIFRQLELINQMDDYAELYDMIKKYPLEGRLIKDAVERLWEEQHLGKSEKVFLMWKEYKNYGYMKKKWKAFLRREDRKEPAWEEVMESLCSFIEPIWNSVCREEVFFGDWMPEIERFLE